MTAANGLPTQQDIARAAGVSQSAVSRVYGGGRVAASTREKVLRTADALGYSRDAIARSLVTGQTTIVAMVIGDIHNPFYPYALEKFSTRFTAAGRQILLFAVPRGQSVDDVLPQALAYRVSGIIIASAELSSNATRMCQEHNIPLVLFNRYVAGSTAPRISCDNRAGGRLAADHLLSLGRKRLAYVGGLATTSTNRDRKRGFIERLKRRGHQLALAVDSEYSYEWGFEAAHRIAQHEGVDAIFCANDVIAMGLLDGLRLAGTGRVPEDIAVIGFDDIPAAAWPGYSLTTIRQPVDSMVQAALKMFTAGGTDAADQRAANLPGELIIRNSTVPIGSTTDR
jgi:DNA-binding LacI/PurR family transcriptional regulator